MLAPSVPSRRPARPSLLPALLPALFLAPAPACTSETGIVIEVSHQGLAAAPDTLRFFIGVQSSDVPLFVPECGDALRFQDEALIADRVVSVAGRDLAADPYRLLLRPGQDLSPDKGVMVVVAALSGNDVVGVGSLDVPVGFATDKVLSWPVSLSSTTENISLTSTGCVCRRAIDGNLAIAPAGDADCDGDPDITDCNRDDATVGHGLPEQCRNNVDDNCNGDIDEEIDADGDGVLNCQDCNDANAAVYPGAPEICDGHDNDCSDATERYTTEPIPCYARVGDTCWRGERICDDDNPDVGWKGECAPVSNAPYDQVSSTLCDVFDECVQTRDYTQGVECADQIFTTFTCELLVKKDGNESKYTICPNRFSLGENIPPLDACRWILIGGTEQRGYTAGLRDLGDLIDFQAVMTSCQGIMRVYESHAQYPELPEPGSIDLWSQVNGQPRDHLRVQFTPLIIDDPTYVCPFNAMTCVVAAPAPAP